MLVEDFLAILQDQVKQNPDLAKAQLTCAIFQDSIEPYHELHDVVNLTFTKATSSNNLYRDTLTCYLSINPIK